MRTARDIALAKNPSLRGRLIKKAQELDLPVELQVFPNEGWALVVGPTLPPPPPPLILMYVPRLRDGKIILISTLNGTHGKGEDAAVELMEFMAKEEEE
jgi:hypothetical protein